MKNKEPVDDRWNLGIILFHYLAYPLLSLAAWILNLLTLGWNWLTQFLVVPSLAQCYSFFIGAGIFIGSVYLVKSIKYWWLLKKIQLRMEHLPTKASPHVPTLRTRNRRKKWTHEDLLKRYPNLR